MHIWLLLLLYPSLCHRLIAIFDCIQVGVDERLLRDDPSEQCAHGGYSYWVAVACIGIVVYCIGIPVAAFIMSYQKSSVQRKRIALLLTSYRKEFCYFEAIDLSRKFILASVVRVVAPGTKMQSWFGLIFSAAYLIVYLTVSSSPIDPLAVSDYKPLRSYRSDSKAPVQPSQWLTACIHVLLDCLADILHLHGCHSLIRGPKACCRFRADELRAFGGSSGYCKFQLLCAPALVHSLPHCA